MNSVERLVHMANQIATNLATDAAPSIYAWPMNNRAQYTALRCTIQASRADNNADRYRDLASWQAYFVMSSSHMITHKTPQP
jgi:hypothetical protein